MKTTLIQKAEALIRKAGGYIRASEAQKNGIPLVILQRMERAKILIREARGLYRLPDAASTYNSDWLLVTTKTPQAVICLISALYFHTLTTQIPHAVYIALPKGARRPRLNYPPLEIVFISPSSYKAGIESHTIDNSVIHIYNKEKTVADCFKFRGKIGEDIAVEALKDYLRQPQRDIAALTHYARLNRVYRVMQPYIQGAL